MNAAAEARSPQAEPAHIVQFYETAEYLADVVADFLAEGLMAGEAGVVIAVPEHARRFVSALRARGVDVDAFRSSGRLLVLDADETLARFMRDGTPDAMRFREVLDEAFDSATGGDRAMPLRAYGEMVDVLWRAGDPHAALRLEELWNDAQRERSFALLCAYVMASFYKETSGLDRVCATHGHVRQQPRGSERTHVHDLAAEIAQRIDVERALRSCLRDLHDQEAARSRAEAARADDLQRTKQLLDVTAAIADAVTPDEVYAAIVDRIGEVLGASSAGLFLVDGEGLRLVRSMGYQERAKPALVVTSLTSEPRIPAADCVLRGAPVWIDSRDELIAAYPHLASITTPGRSYRIACLPLLVEGQAIGSLGLTFDDAAPLDERARDFLRLVARYSAQAVERLRLLQSERATRVRAEAAAERARLLGEASHAFSDAGADVDTVLDRVAALLTSGHADLCGISLITSEGDVLEVATARHRDPAATDEARRIVESQQPQRVGEGLVGRVAATGEAMFLPTVDPRQMTALAHAPYRAWLERHMPCSVIAVPLRARGQPLGVVTVSREEPSPPFTDEDFALLQSLAERAALAIDNARLHGADQEARARAEILYGLAREVIVSDRLDAIYEVALDAITRGLGAARSAILTFGREDRMRFRAWRGLSASYRAAVDGHSPWSRDTPDAEPIVVPDVSQEPSLADYRALFEAEQIGGLAFIPLLSGPEVLGKFMVYFDQPRRMPAAELELARAIADHVAAAVARFSADAELRQIVRFNELFTGILGHDLRNPLAAIVTSAQLAIAHSPGDRVTKPLSRILTSSARMTRMIDQLLDFTRVRVGDGIPLDRKPLDVVSIMRQVMDELEDANPEWTLRLDSALDTTGTWDGDRLAQVFSNLVANAIHHGDVSAGVRVFVDGSSPDRLLVEIHNGGVIPPALLPTIFEPMSGSLQRRNGSRGLGLGLHITREIVRSHGGGISVSSDAESGTVFRIDLPRAPT